ncbi:uncharacterized protein LOC122259724 [Penaeus japonicus]|uniref:uncharacterized protein LOC122259724 n=1 Tax=Penaeus japonicus TaxID=27405 RepID=UPI001C713384|nr:uncharacterized protein LOC122259724 [Penaeus japonicus]
MKTAVKDSKTFVTWWAMVQEKPSLLSKAKQKLSPWRLLDEHFQDGAWEAVEGLARLIKPDSVEVELEGDAPWLLPGLLVVLKQLQKLECECRVEWRRDWHLRAGGVTPTTEALLQACPPTTLALELDEHQDPAALASLPGLVASLGRISCSVNLFFESHFLSHSDPAVSDRFLLPCLGDATRVRFRRLSAHLGLEAASRFAQDAMAEAASSDDDDDEDEVFHRAQPMPMVQAKAAVRYLEVLRVRISSVDVIAALNRSLPFMELLDDLDIHLTLPPFVASGEVPQIAYTKDRLTLRLDRVDDVGADRAGRITTAFSRQYAHVWLCKSRMTSVGGELFLEHLKAGRTLVGAVHVFSVAKGRPDGKGFLRLCAQASLLAAPTALYW